MMMVMIILARSDLGDDKNIWVGVDREAKCGWAPHPHPHTQADGELLKTEAQAREIGEKNLPTTSIHLLHVELK